MSYMGIQELKDADLKSGSATGDGSTTTFAIGWTPPSEQSLFVTINGVLQSASALSISGANCVFTAAPDSGDAIEFKGIQSSGTVVTTTGDGTIDAAKLADNSVTADKILASSVTNAKTDFQPGTTFKGDGSSADGKITLNCSQNTHGVSIQSPAHAANATYTLTLPTTDGSADEYLQTDGSGVLSWAGAGIGVAQTFRENADHVNGSTSIVIGAANFEEADQAGYTALPTSGGITQSSGVFTFPSTGRYLVLSSVRSSQGVTAYSYSNIQYSSNSGVAWTTQSQGVMMYHVIATYADNQCHAVVNINDESTDRVRVTFDSSSTSITVYGDSAFNETYITLIKLA